MEHAAVARVATAMVGGSFDPVHLGHLHLIHAVLSHAGYRRFVLVPVAINNFKQSRHLASPQDRFNMLRLAAKSYASLYPDDPRCSLIVDPMELERGGVSYTSDTVEQIYRKYPVEGKLGLVIGDDLLDGLASWHHFDELKKVVTFVVVRRNAERPQTPDPSLDLRMVDEPLFEDSSSRIRQALASLKKNEPMPLEIRNLMPMEVAWYVEEHRLYRH